MGCCFSKSRKTPVPLKTWTNLHNTLKEVHKVFSAALLIPDLDTQTFLILAGCHELLKVLSKVANHKLELPSKDLLQPPATTQKDYNRSNISNTNNADNANTLYPALRLMDLPSPPSDS